MADLSSSTCTNTSKQYMVRMEAWNNLMMTEMNKLRLEQKHCDVVLTAENKIIYAHRIVLTVGSRLFRNLLSNTNYSQYKELHITLPKDITFAAVDTLVSFMYTGSLSLNVKVLPQIYKAAHYFIMDHVVQICNAYSRMNNNPVLPTLNNLQPPSSPKNVQKPATPIKPISLLPKKQIKSQLPKLQSIKRKPTVQSLNYIRSLKNQLNGKVAVVMLKKLKDEEIEFWCKTKRTIKVEPSLILGPQAIIPAIDIKQEPIECDEPFIDDDITIEEPMIYGDKDVSIVKELNTVTIKKEPLDDDDDSASGKRKKTSFLSSKNVTKPGLSNSEMSTNITSPMPSRNEYSGNVNNASFQEVNTNTMVGNISELGVNVINQTSINENNSKSLDVNNDGNCVVKNIDGNTNLMLNNKPSELGVPIKIEPFTDRSSAACEANSKDYDNTSDGDKKNANFTQIKKLNEQECQFYTNFTQLNKLNANFTQIKKLNEQEILCEVSANTNSATIVLPYQNDVPAMNKSSDSKMASSHSHKENVESKVNVKSCILNGSDIICAKKETHTPNENLNEFKYDTAILKWIASSPCDYDEHSNDVPSISSEHSYSKNAYSHSSSDSEEIDVCGISDIELYSDDSNEIFSSLIRSESSYFIPITNKSEKSKTYKKIIKKDSTNKPTVSSTLRLEHNVREQKRRYEDRNRFLRLKEILKPNSRSNMSKLEILAEAIKTIQQIEMEEILFEKDKQIEKQKNERLQKKLKDIRRTVA